uniref:PB1 domain-containing protein n=1 Tax=Nelumbo nucifera TaxID=4432 RepID=A0A822XPH3_NELNU|nr:TPA_asm: hypothetical protein HUJ06_023670 [Nelumbo nucifera]
MDNYSFSSYPDSVNSSPRSREIDCENPSWDDPPNYKVKFMCSYGGKIHPRPHDNQLAYIGGDTKILTVDRNIRFSGIISKLSSLCDADVSLFKYQLPGEDLDALISVSNDEDLEHMMLEYDRLYRASAKPARLRLFLFPQNSSVSTVFSSNEEKPDKQWFLDALNNIPFQPADDSSSPAAATQNNPDFLFGFDKGYDPPTASKSQETTVESLPPEKPPSEIALGSDSNKDGRHIETLSPAEIQRQIEELQKFQISGQEQTIYQRKTEESLAKVFPGEYYVQNIPEKMAAAPPPIPVSVSLPATYWPDRHMATGGYSPAAETVPGTEQPVYLIPAPGSVYHAPTGRSITGQIGQNYYAMPRVVPEVYREAPPPVYGVGAPTAAAPAVAAQAKVGAYADGGIGVIKPAAMADAGYTQIAYDGAGRQMYYYTTAQPGIVPQYQTITATSVDLRRAAAAAAAGVLSQEGTFGWPV